MLTSTAPKCQLCDQEATHEKLCGICFDEIGCRFGRLVALPATLRRNNGGHWVIDARCDCGKTKTVRRVDLLRRATKSCGCLRSDTARRRMAVEGSTLGRLRATHGLSGTEEYEIWITMRARCRGNNSRYGARGISVCDRWKDFSLFLADMGTRPSAHHSIDRIDNNGAYSPENCQWATATQQARNRSSTRFIEYSGKTLCVADWARITGIPATTLRSRLRVGCSVEKLFRASRSAVPHE